jgi:hypothetical protein
VRTPPDASTRMAGSSMMLTAIAIQRDRTATSWRPRARRQWWRPLLVVVAHGRGPRIACRISPQIPLQAR